MSVDTKEHRLEGYHGTCKSFALQIRKAGFNSGLGRHGSGIYLWSHDDGALDLDLAICYAKDRSKNGQYQHVTDPSLAVVTCTVVLPSENSLLSLESDSVQKMLRKYIETQKSSIDKYKASIKGNNDKLLSEKVISGFIKLYSETIDTPIKALKAKTIAPSSYRNRFNRALIWQGCDRVNCVVVRDSSIIRSSSIEICWSD